MSQAPRASIPSRPAGARAGIVVALLLPLLCACGGGGGGDAGGGTVGPLPASQALIRSVPFSRLVIEVDGVAAFPTRASTATGIEGRLDALLDKPDGIEVVADGVLPAQGSNHGYTFTELQQLALQTFDLAVAADTVKMHVLVLDGFYADAPSGSTVLGIAWGQRNIAIFRETIDATCAGAGAPPLLAEQLCADAELFVWLHEVGHVLGLVNNGLPMQAPHEDATHPHHDEDEDCVMYWAYEGDALVNRILSDLLLSGSTSLDFDAHCKSDIAAVRDAP